MIASDWMKAELDAERRQLLDHWRRRVRRSPALEFMQVKRIHAANGGDVRALATLADDLRHFHDKLGYMAKGSAHSGGLCAGSIFRTEKFIQTSARIGSKRDQSVHIEHTFPIRQLKIEFLKQQRFPDYITTLTWLLKYSVTTAFHEEEKAHLTGRASNSEALNSASPEYQKPFARYGNLHRAAGVVWNVFDGEKVDPERFNFTDHVALVLRLLSEAGAADSMVSRIRVLAEKL